MHISACQMSSARSQPHSGERVQRPRMADGRYTAIVERRTQHIKAEQLIEGVKAESARQGTTAVIAEWTLRHLLRQWQAVKRQARAEAIAVK